MFGVCTARRAYGSVLYMLDVRMHKVAEMPAAVSQDAYLVETKSDNQDLKHLYHAVGQNMHYLSSIYLV